MIIRGRSLPQTASDSNGSERVYCLSREYEVVMSEN